ncbi:MAG: hypothetical protein ACL93V_08860 [Candidatus Electrothrix sp. YB6]
MKTGRNFIAMMAAGILFSTGSAGSASAQTFDAETRNLAAQTMEKKANSVVLKVFPDQTAFSEIQQRMMATASEAVKKSTAARKSASVIETCMECRAMTPIEFVVSAQTDVLDAETQAAVNRKMAEKIKTTIQEISSDPAVARVVQGRMMQERMKDNPLRAGMQPVMMSNILNSTETSTAINVTERNRRIAIVKSILNRELNRETCSDKNDGQPNC